MSGEALTVRQLYSRMERRMAKAGCDSPAFAALCLLEDLGGLGRGAVQASADRLLPPEVCQRLLAAADRRAAGEPLQYLLGTWDFLSLTLEVGEGVLIPRPETELLCQVAAAALARRFPAGSDRKPTILDLCAGSGCVGLGIASLHPAVHITALEKSPAAFAYLQRNCRRYPSLPVEACLADILCDARLFGDSVDAIVSNPPYIATSELDTLQREVQHEPRLALDGGDGYRFYRVIAEDWVPRLRPGGFVAVEVGVGQAATVACLWETAGLSGVCVYPDDAGIDRIVYAEKPNRE